MEEEIKELMDDYDIDEGEAEELQDFISETGLGTDEAHELWELR